MNFKKPLSLLLIAGFTVGMSASENYVEQHAEKATSSEIEDNSIRFEIANSITTGALTAAFCYTLYATIQKYNNLKPSSVFNDETLDMLNYFLKCDRLQTSICCNVVLVSLLAIGTCDTIRRIYKKIEQNQVKIRDAQLN